jgi:hypothetical protein
MNGPAILLFTLLLFPVTLACHTAKMPLSTPLPTVEIQTGKAAEIEKDTLLVNLLRRYPQYFDTLLKQDSSLRIQIIYTQIDRGQYNRPVFTHHYFGIDTTRYFYPASTVKMPVAFLALQRLNELAVHGLDRNATMITEAGAAGQTAVYNDPSTADGRPTIASYIKKIFLVSDNDAFNRLYEFLGQEYINNSLHQMGYTSAQVLHRLNVSLPEAQNRVTNPVKFYNTAGQLIYQQPLAESRLVYQPRQDLLGKGYYQNDSLVNGPFDFSKKNRLTLPDLHSMLQSVIFPAAVGARQRFNLKEEDYRFLYRCMSMKPGESAYPQYDSSYSDSYVKFLLAGGEGPLPHPDLRIFNKPGDAYGFLTDVAYIVDFKAGVEFMLSATILCNSDGIFNDDRYDYKTVGLPFMKHLGEVIYERERNRVKKTAPDLSGFRFDYAER